MCDSGLHLHCLHPQYIATTAKFSGFTLLSLGPRKPLRVLRKRVHDTWHLEAFHTLVGDACALHEVRAWEVTKPGVFLQSMSMEQLVIFILL